MPLPFRSDPEVNVIAPVPPLPTATVPVTLAAVPVTLPDIALVTVKSVKVPTDVKDELTTVLFKVVPDNVPASAITVIFAEPSKSVPLIVFDVTNLVAVAAFPVVF